MRFRITKIDHYPVTLKICNVTIPLLDDTHAQITILNQYLAQIFRVDLRGQAGRANKITKHHGQMPALGL